MASEVHVTKQQPRNSVVAEKKFEDAAVQTEAVTPEDVSVLQKIDSNVSFMYAQTREAVSVIYNTLENFKVINRRQEEVILRMEKRLEKYEEKENKEEQDREERRRREERDREDRRRREERDRDERRVRDRSGTRDRK